MMFPAGRLGIGYELFPGTLDIIIAGGGAYSNYDAPWKSFYNGSLLLNFHLGPLYIGAGGGVTTENREALPKSYAEAVVNIGFNIFNFSKTKISLLFEGAGPVKDLALQDHYRVMGAFRITF
jgi:hypothetical protein